MMVRYIAIACAFCLAMALPAAAQSSPRDATRAKLATLLTNVGSRPDINATFRQSTNNPYNFVASMTGLRNADSLEVILSVSDKNTLGVRIYPHYKGNYINLGRAVDQNGLMRRLLAFSDQNFLYWGADDEGDIFTAFTFTLESGFPDDAITIVLRSIRNADGFVGQLRPFIDGSTAG